MEWYKNGINDKSIKVKDGLQLIQTLDGYAILINIKDGLPYVRMSPYTDDEEWDELPHIILTSDVNWDPTILDHNLDDDENWFNAISDLQSDPTTNLFDEYGNYRKHVVVQETDTFFDALEDEVTIHDVVDECMM